jgi:hypothetical protein
LFLFVRLILGSENGNSTYLLAARNKLNKLGACLLDIFFNPEDGSNIFLIAVSSKQKKFTSFLLGLLVNPEGGGSTCFRNVDKFSPDFMASHPRE